MLKNFFLVLFAITGNILFAACGAVSTTESSSKTTNSPAVKANENRTGETRAAIPEKAVEPDAQQQKPTESRDDTKPATEDATVTDGFELRCGWYSNPTPANHWLEDRDGQWIIGTQGARQAEGDYPPEFKANEWVATNGGYGYGCACLQVKVDKKEGYITEIKSGYSKPLSACRSDRALKEPKDE